jgi:hypothetical protein
MNRCQHCGNPRTWSEWREYDWCAVYGDHRTPIDPVERRHHNLRVRAAYVASIAQRNVA